MPALERVRAPKRRKSIHIKFTDDEELAVRLVHAASGQNKIGQWCRGVLLDAVIPQYRKLRTEGLKEIATAGGR